MAVISAKVLKNYGDLHIRTPQVVGKEEDSDEEEEEEIEIEEEETDEEMPLESAPPIANACPVVRGEAVDVQAVSGVLV